MYAPECVFCDGHAETTINNGKTDCCRKCKEDLRRENEEANEPTFEKMAKLMHEVKREPVMSRLVMSPKAMRLLKEFSKSIGNVPAPSPAINIYTGTPVYVDKTLKPGQWKAVDSNGNVLDEGNILPKRLRTPTV